MNIITFTYTKENGETSQRVIVPLVVPTDKYFGIDIGELDFEDQGMISAEIEKAEFEKQEKIREIMAKYDVANNFRTFLPSRMSNIVEE